MASHRLCERLMSSGFAARHRICVVGEEPQAAYDRVHLTAWFAHRDAEQLSLATPEHYAAHGITLRLGRGVSVIDAGLRKLVLSDGEVLHYQKLVLVTGSRPFVPKIPGVALPNVFVYRTLQDVASIDAAARDKRRAIVLGGGLLGLEAARALHGLGLHTLIVESASHLMPRQLGPEHGGRLLAHVAELGIEVQLRAQARAIEHDGSALSVQLEERSLSTDLVVIAAGVRPRDELAAGAGLEVGPRGGFVVDDTLQTSDPHIYAIGECVCHRMEQYGLVGPSYAMADVLAERLNGKTTTFTGGDTSCRLKLFDVEVTALGKSAADVRSVSYEDEDALRTLRVDEGRLVGAVSVGPWPAVARVELAIGRAEVISERALRRFERRGELMSTRRNLPVEAWPQSALVCNCERVSKGELEAAITTGARSIEALCAATGAGRVCGSCKPLLARLCGAETAAPPASRASHVVLVSSVLAAFITLAGLLMPAPRFAVSVQDAGHAIDQLFRDPLLKQLTGFGIVGLSLLGLVLSLRRRVKFARRGSFVVYRALHTCLGLLALMALLAHTGMRLGQNLNFALVCCFLGAALVGSGAGVVTALEAGDSSAALYARTLRPWLQALHLFLCWPLPLLIGLHILAVYYF